MRHLQPGDEYPLLSSTDDEDDDSLDDGELTDGIRPPAGIEIPVAPSSPADSLPEEVTDDDIFGEEDFEVLERAFPARIGMWKRCMIWKMRSLLQGKYFELLVSRPNRNWTNTE